MRTFFTELNHGKSVQLAIIRSDDNITLHVNEYNETLPFGIKLLTEYSNKPWINPQVGMLYVNYHNCKELFLS